MEALPPVSWDQLATKDDLNTLATVIGAEFTAVRGEFAEQIGEVHKEIGGLHVGDRGADADDGYVVCWDCRDSCRVCWSGVRDAGDPALIGSSLQGAGSVRPWETTSCPMRVR